METAERWEYGVIVALSTVVGGVACGGFLYALVQLVRNF